MSIKLAIIDYEICNVMSVANAFEAIGAHPLITKEPAQLRAADCLVLPGVGAFSMGMDNLRRLGLIDVLNELVIQERKPILGICLGLQLFARRSFELGEFEGLGWLDANVMRLNVEKMGLKVPHVGWNDVVCVRESPIYRPVDKTASFYFVHSYHMVFEDESPVVGKCEYGENFAACVQKGNICGVQFHPEKSQENGLSLLKGYIELAGREVF